MASILEMLRELETMGFTPGRGPKAPQSKASDEMTPYELEELRKARKRTKYTTEAIREMEERAARESKLAREIAARGTVFVPALTNCNKCRMQVLEGRHELAGMLFCAPCFDGLPLTMQRMEVKNPW